MIPSPSSRRAAVDRWIASLNPFFAVITTRAKNLKLGEPDLQVGPAFIKKTSAFDPDKIRAGAVWWVNGTGNVGFHVDFHKGGTRIEAWTGKSRRGTLWIAGKLTEDCLKKDLKVVMVSAGLTDLARTEEVRNSLFSARYPQGKPALDQP